MLLDLVAASSSAAGMRSLYAFALFSYAVSFLLLHIVYLLCTALSVDDVFPIRHLIAFHRHHIGFHRARSSNFRPLVGLYPILLGLIAIVTAQLITGVPLPVTYVSGHKMSPVLTDGDFIFVESIKPVHVKINDLILFHKGRGGGANGDEQTDINSLIRNKLQAQTRDLTNINQIRSVIDIESRKASLESAKIEGGSNGDKNKNNVKNNAQDGDYEGSSSNIIPIFVRKVVKIEEFPINNPSQQSVGGSTMTFRFFVCSEETIPEKDKCSYVQGSDVMGKTCYRIPKAAAVLRYMYFLYKKFNSFQLRDKSVLSLSDALSNYARNSSVAKDL